MQQSCSLTAKEIALDVQEASRMGPVSEHAIFSSLISDI